MKIDMAWLREWCDPGVGDEDLAHQLTMAGVEVDDLVAGPDGSAVLELALTPNRADCFSVRGVAREVSALFSAPLSARDVAETPAAIDARRELGLVAPDACPRFAGRVIEGLDPGAETPGFIKERLAAAGERPQHLLVDVTNYVMLEMGQPMHAYDLERLDGGLRARWAEPGESLTLLDGTELKLESDVLVIADEKRAVAAAGIMGGLGSAVGDGTSGVLLESAFFAPGAVAGKARRLGLQTEASLRFERGVDPSGQAEAIERATELIVAAAGGEPGPVIDSLSEKDLPQRGAIDLRSGRLAALLGVALPNEDVSAMLRRLTMTVEETEAGWRVTPPSFRFDLAEEADLVEEIARVHGYENIPETPANWSAHPSASTERQVDPDRVRALLVDRGYHECLNYSFLDEESHKPFHSGEQELELANPLSGELSVLRRSLWPGLLRNYRTNRDRGTTDARLFEIGVCFSGTRDDIREETWLAGLLAGGAMPEQWGSPRRDGGLLRCPRRRRGHPGPGRPGPRVRFPGRRASRPSSRTFGPGPSRRGRSGLGGRTASGTCRRGTGAATVCASSGRGARIPRGPGHRGIPLPRRAPRPFPGCAAVGSGRRPARRDPRGSGRTVARSDRF